MAEVLVADVVSDRNDKRTRLMFVLFCLAGLSYIVCSTSYFCKAKIALLPYICVIYIVGTNSVYPFLLTFVVYIRKKDRLMMKRSLVSNLVLAVQIMQAQQST